MSSTFDFLSHLGLPIVSIRITHNEPFCVSAIGYGYARFAPGRSSDRHKSKEGDSSREPWMWVLQSIDDKDNTESPIAGNSVSHHLILAHAHAVKYFREHTAPVHGGTIGITLDASFYMPYDDKPESMDGRSFAARRSLTLFYQISLLRRGRLMFAWGGMPIRSTRVTIPPRSKICWEIVSPNLLRKSSISSKGRLTSSA